MIEVQQAAAGSCAQLVIELPQRGRMLEFSRPLLVEPDSPLELSFDAGRSFARRVPRGLLWAFGLFLGLAAVIHPAGWVPGGPGRLRARPSRPGPAPPPDDQPISAEELDLDARGRNRHRRIGE